MDKDKLYMLKVEASKIKPILNVGKNGVSSALIEEMKKHLKKNRLIKVKLLKSSKEDNDNISLAQEIAQSTGSEIVEIKGNTLVLYK